MPCLCRADVYAMRGAVFCARYDGKPRAGKADRRWQRDMTDMDKHPTRLYEVRQVWIMGGEALALAVRTSPKDRLEYSTVECGEDSPS
jgi:hypothetical protein